MHRMEAMVGKKEEDSKSKPDLTSFLFSFLFGNLISKFEIWIIQMTFYLKPPRGLTNLHQLEECVKQRLICYDNMSTCQNKETNFYNFEFLVEDSAFDRAGHFLLRLSAYYHNIFLDQFLQNEQRLLEIRLNYYDIQDFKHFLKRLMKHSMDNLKECNAGLLNKLHVMLVDVSSSMLRKGYLRHIFTGEHKETCEQFILKVPFQYCCPLIHNREVNLNGGFAEIPCGLWKRFLLSLFHTYLKTAVKEMKYSQCVDKALTDHRIKYILRELSLINERGVKHGGDKTEIFSISKIKEESKLFPLCMLNLYKILDKTNRLPHNERFDFSLYMKGIGVSLSDSLKFWEMAYSKEHTSCSKCTHDWQKNEKRYIYGIRHLYGFEGSRKNYQPRSCKYLQKKVLGPTEDGGCPFKHFDDSNLREVLKTLLPDNSHEVEVMMYKRTKDPSASCKLFFDVVLNKMTGKDIEMDLSVGSPVDYYLTLKHEIELAVNR